jgi:20S proteasome alpha/beta subunit
VLRSAIEGELTSEKVEMAVIPVDTGKFKKMSPEEIGKYIQKLGKGSAKPVKE